MRIINKNLVHPDALIIYFSLLVFLLRMYACRYIVPDYNGMDYYGYIELAKNIFHHLDFTVRWELDAPLQYPPFFSILIYLLSFLTKNFISSIQYVSIFCASFYLVPLFSLTRKILNGYFAVLAAVFTTYYFGIRPCHMLTMDFFYSFLIITICWLIWDTLTNQTHKAGRYALAGLLVSIAYLTKYSGILFGYAGMASILYYFIRYQHSLKTGFKYCGFLLLGAAPLLIAYQLLLFQHTHRNMASIAAYAFFDGNYVFEKGWDYREDKLSELNRGGTEFAYVSFLEGNNEFKFFLQDPAYVFDKYAWGLNKMTQEMTFALMPGGNIAKSRFYDMGPQGKDDFNKLRTGNWNAILREVSSTEVQVNPDYFLKKEDIRKLVGDDAEKVWDILQRSLISRGNINFVFQGAFLLLLMISGMYFRWHFNLTHILIFSIGMALIPFYFINERYLMPFMPLYFILWLFIFKAVYSSIRSIMPNKVFLRCVAVGIFVIFISIYWVDSYRQIYQRYRYLNNSLEQKELWLRAADWVKIDSMGLHQRAKIMECSNNYLSYLTDSDFIRLPFVISDWGKVIHFALIKKVNYIAIDWDGITSFLKFSENEFKGPAGPYALVTAIKAKSAVMEKAKVPAGLSPIESLNYLLGYRDLYQVMPVWPTGSTYLIYRLKAGGDYNFLDLNQLNRLLIEANFPHEAPHKLWVDSDQKSVPGTVQMIHEIYWKNNTVWLFKI